MNDKHGQGSHERDMQPQRLSDVNHQLDAYPIKDEAQRQRLLKILLEDQQQEQPNETKETE
jgi:hypothetical protein